MGTGQVRHRITIHIGRRKVECYGLWRDGQYPARKMAEHLRGAMPNAAASSSKPIAKKARIAKAHAIEDIIQGQQDAMDHTVIRRNSAEVKLLPDVLEDDEMPERFLQNVEHYTRHGLNIGTATNKLGMLVTTDRRLLFLNKEVFSKAEVLSCSYKSISRIESTKGIIFGSVTVHMEDRAERFDKIFAYDVSSFVEHLQSKIA